MSTPSGHPVVVDPNLPAGASQSRPLVLPPGTWQVTAGPASVAASSLDQGNPTRILLGTVADATFVQGDTITLPDVEAWHGGTVACLSGADLVLASDAKGSLWLVAPGEDPVELPNQRPAVGGCTWLDDGHAIWSQSDGRLAAFDLETATTTQLPANPIVGNPSAGQGRVAGVTAGHRVEVSPVTADGSSVRIGAALGDVDAADAARLSADGRWLIASGSDGTGRIFRVDAAGLTPDGSIPLGSNARVAWLP